MKRVYVWTLPTRIFHWLFVTLITAAWIASLEDRWLNIHAAIGSSIAVLLLFRILWGFMGPEYSRFRDFSFSIIELKEYLLGILRPSKHYLGHNPAASYVMVAMLIMVGMAILTGFLTYGVQENRGLLAFLHDERYAQMELFGEIHETCVNLMWLLIGAHVGGVLLDRLLHPSQRVLHSMVDGYKVGEGNDTALTLLQKSTAFLFISLSIAVLIYALSVSKNPIIASHTAPVNYEHENPAFVNECGSCHTLYPPSLLPKESWKKLMGNLENHFGDDASLDPADHSSILAYLLKHSAETSKQEMSLKMMTTFKNRDIIAITHTPFWKKTHSDISQDIFKSEQVKSRANCKACHSDIEQGMVEDMAIAIPKG